MAGRVPSRWRSRSCAAGKPDRPTSRPRRWCSGAGERLGALANALAAYERRLGELGALDRSGALRAAVEALGKGARSDELRALDLLVVEGFTALSPAALELLVALARLAGRTHARVPFTPERAELCTPAEALLRRLEALHELSARRELSVALEPLSAGDTRSPRLLAMLRSVAGGAGIEADPSSAGDALGIAGEGERGEAEEVAALLARWLTDGPSSGRDSPVATALAPEEVIVLCPAPESAAPLLARACARAGVPLSIGRGAPLAELPPVRAVCDALAAAVRPERRLLERLAGSPYLGVHGRQRELSAALDRAGALDGRGDPLTALECREQRLRSPAASRERALAMRGEEVLRELRARTAMLGPPARPRAHAERLRGFLAVTGMRRHAARAALPLALRDLEALARVEEVAGELAGALSSLGQGDAPMEASRWAALLGLAVEGARVGAPAAPASGAVELWPLAEAPGLSARACVVTGCARGAFPSTGAVAPLLREEEREALRRAAGRAVIATGGERRARALHAAFGALAVGREAVALSWAGAGPEGEGARPAGLAVEALAAAGAEVPSQPSSPAPGGGWRVDPGRRASALARGSLEEARWRALVSGGAAPSLGALPEHQLEALREALPAEWSASQLELHARCPYRLFAGVALGLRDPEANDLDLDPRGEGSLAHAILERFYRAMREQGALPLRGAAAEREALQAAARGCFEELEAAGRAGDPSTWPGRRAAVVSRLLRVIAAEAGGSEGPAGGEGAVPTLLEYRFGGTSAVPPLAVSDGSGRTVKLAGRIDRVDASSERLLLIDYKDGRASSAWKRKLSPEALGATNFQVPAYLLAARRALPGRARLEATYLLLRSAERLEPLALPAPEPGPAGTSAAGAGARPGAGPPARGGAEEAERSGAGWVARFERSVVEAVESMRAGYFPVRTEECAGCPYGALCRVQGRGEPSSAEVL